MTSGALDVLAHELRSPVAALVAIADAYAGADAATRARLRELAVAAGNGIDRLLADPALLSYGIERIDVAGLVAVSVETWVIEGAAVVANVEAELVVDGDPARLRQALDNLIANALGHSLARAPVSVTASHVGRTVVIEVADTGDGIPESELERIFEAGVRHTTDRPGSGLGLAIVRAVARAHGGEVSVTSRPGRGSTFRLELPGAFASG